MYKELKIAHLNIFSTGPDLTKPQTLINSLAKQKTDIICITEAKITNKNRNYFSHSLYDTHINASPEQTTKQGIVTLTAKHLRDHISKHDTLYEGTTNLIKLSLDHKNFNIICIYAPSQGDTESVPFFTKLFEDNNLQHDDNNIIIGDFNTVQDDNMDRPLGAKEYYKKKTARLINNFKLDNSLVDPWRITYPEIREYSWKNSRYASRIDYALISAHTYHQVQSIEYFTPPIHSDHKGLKMQIDLGKFNRGKGYFKLNNSLLTDPTFIQKVNEMIDQTLHTHHTNHAHNIPSNISQYTIPEEELLDLITFNATTLAREHTQEAKAIESSEEKYLKNEIKPIEA